MITGIATMTAAEIDQHRICRYIAEHGSLWEWKTGVDWATEEQLRQCEVAGLVTVNWRQADAYYPWSTVALTELGKHMVGRQLFLELMMSRSPNTMN